MRYDRSATRSSGGSGLSSRPSTSRPRSPEARTRAVRICQAVAVGRVIVLGGGLAGLVCAKVLAERKVEVEVWEASARFGGKAGSTLHNGRWVDHGFHIFPAWYQNTNALLNELGIVDVWRSKDFDEVDAEDVPGKRRGDSRGKPIKYRKVSRTMVATLDMISRPPWYLDDLSVDGFLRARLYAGRSSGERLREISRKALGSPAYLTSSLSMQRNLQWWMPVFNEPNWNALKGSLQTTFIDPLADAARAAGAKLFLNRKLDRIEVRNGRLVPMAVGDAPGSGDEDAIVVSALPVEVVKDIARRNPVALGQLVELNSKLKDIQYLDASPLAALDLHLTKRLDSLPPHHFILRASRYDLTGLDITKVWKDYAADPKHPTVIQLCAGDTTAIRWLPDEAFLDRLIDEVRRFFPFERADVDREHTLAMKHIDAPLFMNEVGSNSKRVEPNGPNGSGVTDLYIIGDHTDTPVDLACMEGAVYSALLAAQAICKGLGIDGPAPKELQGVPVGQKRFLKVARYPLGWAALPLRLTEPYYRQRVNQQQAPLHDG